MREDAHVAVAVSDQGRGVAPDLLPRLYSKHGAAAEDGRTVAPRPIALRSARGWWRPLAAASGLRAPAPGTAPPSPSPCPRPRSPAPEWPPTRPAGRRQGEKARILAVDDDPRTLRFVRDALAAAGFAPPVTGVPGQLVRITRAKNPGLVLLDHLLPGRDGIERMNEVRELSDRPVIHLGGNGR